MVEIKCPPKRKFTKTVPDIYLQVQGQLEVCDLDDDFLSSKIEEYNHMKNIVKIFLKLMVMFKMEEHI